MCTILGVTLSYDVTIIRINSTNDYDDAMGRTLTNCHNSLLKLPFHRSINFNRAYV